MIEINTPIVLVNLKTYIEATGKRALQLARIAEEVSSETGICIGLAPQFTDIEAVASEAEIPVFAQHIDYYPQYNSGWYIIHIRRNPYARL